METSQPSNTSTESNGAATRRLRPEAVLTLVARITAGDADITVCRRQAEPPTPEEVSHRLAIALRDFERGSAVLSTCAVVLPAECAVGEPDVRGTLEVAERMLRDAVVSLETMCD